MMGLGAPGGNCRSRANKTVVRRRHVMARPTCRHSSCDASALYARNVRLLKIVLTKEGTLMWR